MATVEEQLKQLAKDVKTIGVEQIKGNQDLKEQVEWKQTSSRTAADLQESIDNLTSRIQLLEDTFFKPLPVVPPREEEGRAQSHCKNIYHQGVDPGPQHMAPPWSWVRTLGHSLSFSFLFLYLVKLRLPVVLFTLWINLSMMIGKFISPITALER
jgi:hypothetical protein